LKESVNELLLQVRKEVYVEVKQHQAGGLVTLVRQDRKIKFA
jgi:hypothetical protein